MAKRLTDKDKKKIIAYYVQCENYSETSRKFKVSATTVKKVVWENDETVRKCEIKKEKNIEDVLEYMDTRKKDVITLLDKLLAAMTDEDKIAKTPLNQLATTMGIVIDKFTMIKHKRDHDKAIEELRERELNLREKQVEENNW